jgi:N-acetylmuramoyl-L-alanine amidase
MSKICIEVGHGGSDPGAAANGFLEKEITLNVSLELKRQLERHGQTVLISRTTDVDDKAESFYEKAKNWKPDLGISVHANAGGGKGFECYSKIVSSDLQLTQHNTRLCKAIETEVILIGQNSRGIKPSGFIMSNLPVPYAYCELGFLDNKEDLQLFDTPDKQKKFSVAYAKGILNYLGVAWQNEKTTEQKKYCTGLSAAAIMTKTTPKRGRKI